MSANQEADMPKTLLVGNVLGSWNALGTCKRDYLEDLRRARKAGVSVSELSRALGISRTAVYKQLGRKEG